MPTSTVKSPKQQDRLMQFFEQHPTQTLTIEQIKQATQISEDQLKGMLGNMASNGGQLHRIGQNAYFYSQAPLPRQGETFTGEVVSVSFTGAAVVRDSSGGTWKILPV